MKKNQLIQQNLEDKMMNCLSINTDTNKHAFCYANIVLVTRIIAILRKYPIKVKALELEKVIISIDKPTVKIFLAELPTEDEPEDGFDGLIKNFECRKDAIMYYNMLLKSFRDRIDSVAQVIFSVEHFGDPDLPDEEEPTKAKSRGEE